MKNQVLKLALFALILTGRLLAHAQSTVDVVQQELSLYRIENELLPLEHLLDSAEVHSPLLKMIDADIYIQDLRVKSEQKDWLSYFSFTGTAKYGMFDNLVINEDTGNDYFGSTSTKQTRYTVGLSIKVPFSAIFDKYNRDAALSEKVKLQHHRKNTISELRKLVITQYGNLLRAHTKLITKTSELETARLQMADVELNYKNGKIPLSTFTKQKSELLNLQLVMEEVKIEFKVALFHLQETVGVDLNLKS